MNPYRLTLAALLAPALLASMIAPAAADEVIWRNVSDFPAALEKTDAGWSAIRIEQEGFSYRAAADDFILKETTRLSAIEFWTVTLTDNPLLGIDWYIFESTGDAGPPGKLIAYASDVPATHTDTGLVNANFGPIYLEHADVNVVLEPGHYFLAFRSVHQNAGDKGNGALTTYDQLGTSRAWWTFTLSADGQGGAWDMMEIFNLQDNEWAFQILAADTEECYPDCNGDTVLDFFDFLCYLNAFDNQEAFADCEANGVFDFFDFLCYLNAFDAGC